MILTNRSFIAAAIIIAIGGAVVAQQAAIPRGSHDWAPRAPAGKHHTLAATLETVQWGWLDPKESPKLTVNSGDTISIETMMHSHDKVQPGITMEQVVELRKANPGGGPHSMTGPIFVNGAEPGDVLEVRILRIEPKPFAVNFNLPGKDFPTIGALASEMPEGFIRFFTLDLQKRTAEFKPGITLDLQPFPGTFAVGIDPNDPSPRKGGVKRPDGAGVDAAPVEERLEPGHQRDAGRHDDLHSGVPEGRADLDRRLALPPGQRRGQPDRARVLVQGDPHPADRQKGHEARVAVHRDAHALDQRWA